MVREGTAEEAYEVLSKVPELKSYVTLERMVSKCENGALVLVFELDGELVGFKVGYPESSDEFYSWLGAVVPEHRQSGVAQALLEYQEGVVARNGYRCLSVKSMNQYPSMLRLLIKNGYDITKVEHYGDSDVERIHFKKSMGGSRLSPQ